MKHTEGHRSRDQEGERNRPCWRGHEGEEGYKRHGQGGRCPEGRAASR